MKKLNKRISLIIILLIYMISIALAIVLSQIFSNENTIKQVLIADIFATCIVFAFSFFTKNSSVYDPYWSVIPPLIAGYLIFINPQADITRQLIVFALISFWSIRLTANWAMGWTGFKHEDWRYRKIAKDTGRFYWFVSFMGIHMLPTLIVFLACLPLFYILANQQAISIIELFAIFLTFLAILIEWISDKQLKKYKKSKTTKKYMDKGLWSLSRHPNYLGEITFWFGLFLFIPLSGLNKQYFYSAIGFIAMVLLFRFISIPLMEKRNLVKKEGYANYIKRVPMLLPIKRKYRN